MKFFEPSKTPAEGLGLLVLFQLVEEAVPAFFRADRRICVSRAPGRLDVMGGFADASGSLVLQLPTAEAACAAAQVRDDDLVRLWSPCRDGSRTQLLSVRLPELGLPRHAIDYAQAQALFAREARDRWAGYLLGGLLVLARERGLQPQRGFDLLVHSDVPEGVGAGSSSAVAVAAMCALAQAQGVTLLAREVALLCQLVETEIMGRASGAKDPMTAACAEADQLLALRCQPCELERSIALPQELEIIGLDSGVLQAKDDQAAVRAGAGIGASMLSGDPEWSGHLADFPLEAFHARWQRELPETITGAEFHARRGGPDPRLRLEPRRSYAVRATALQAIEENARVAQFAELLQQDLTASRRRQLGELMFASHAAYAACGLGNPIMDFLVQRAQERMAAGGQITGAKATGSGGGGTLVLVGERGKVWHEALRIKKALHQQTGHSGHIFRWSSPGALPFGPIELRPVGG